MRRKTHQTKKGQNKMKYAISENNKNLAAQKTLGNALVSAMIMVIAILGFKIHEEGLVITAMSFALAFWTVAFNNFCFWCYCNQKLKKERG